MLQDEEIVELYFQRNERALLETSNTYGYYCRCIAQRILNDEEAAKECFNDALHEIWNSIPPTRPNSFKVYVGQITRHLSLKCVRSAEKRGCGEATLALDELEECGADIADGNTEQIEENAVACEVLNKFLATSSGQTRRIFVRRYW